MDNLLSPEDIARYFQIESSGNPNARTGSYRGLGQFGPREEAHFGISDANRTDRTVQAAAVAQEAAENRARLRTVLGREPTASDYYLAHQQGGAGSSALFSHPDTPAWQAIRPFYSSDAAAQKAITGNIPSNHPLAGQHPDKITSADFANLWASKFNGAAPAPGAPTTNLAGQSPTDAQPGSPAAPAMDIASLLKASGAGAGQNPLQKLGAGLVSQAGGAGGPQGFKFMDPGMPALLPTGPVRPLPLQIPKLV